MLPVALVVAVMRAIGVPALLTVSEAQEVALLVYDEGGVFHEAIPGHS
jgi:hypothetical protein